MSVVVFASLLAGTPRAEASPKLPPTAPDATSSSTGVSLSPAQWRFAELARDARNKAVSARDKSMDYRKMKTVFKKEKKYGTDWRRQYAAGCRQMGGKINHISKAEFKQVEKRRKQVYGKRKIRSFDDTGRSLLDGSKCKGRSGTKVNGNTTIQYLNSCEVIDAVWAWGICGTAMGAVGFFAGSVSRVSWPAYAVGAFCGYWATVIGREAAKSDTGSVYIRTYKAEAYQPYPGGVKYYIRTTIHAQ